MEPLPDSFLLMQTLKAFAKRIRNSLTGILKLMGWTLRGAEPFLARVYHCNL